MCLLAIYLFSFVNCLFKSFPHYSNWSIFLFNIYFIFNFCFLHILFYLKILTYLKVVKVLFLLEAIWFWLLPLGLESIIIIIIIIWNKVGSRVHSSPTPPCTQLYSCFSITYWKHFPFPTELPWYLSQKSTRGVYFWTFILLHWCVLYSYNFGAFFPYRSINLLSIFPYDLFFDSCIIWRSSA